MNGDDLERLERYVRGELSSGEQAKLELRLGSDRELTGLLEEVREASELTSLIRSSRSIELPREAPSVAGYEIDRELYRGGQGVVYGATQRSTGRRVAIKVLLAGRASSRRQQQRLEREIDLAASISHPGVVTVFDRATTDDDHPALVMELIDGRPLDTYLQDESPTVERVLRLMIEISEIVSAAHQRGVIHRDLKPSNILIDSDDRPRVLDFGLAKALAPDASRSLVTQEGEFMGTLAYAGPEQVERGAVAADVRSDVYALGAMLSEALTGCLPVDVSGPIAGAIGRIREVSPAAPSSLRAGLDDDIDTIVLTALAKEPDRRYQSASAFASDIRRYLADEPILARPASTMYQLRKFATRNRALVGATCVAALALVAITVAVSVALVRTNAANRRANDSKTAALIDADKEARMNGFLRELLSSVEPGRAGPDLKVVDLLADADARIESEFAEYPALRAKLHTTVGTTYWRLGLVEPAEEHMGRAVELLDGLESAQAERDLPAALSALGSIAQTKGDFDRAQSLHEQALTLWERPELEVEIGRFRTLGNLAAVRLAKGEVEAGERLYTEALAGLEGADDDSRLLRAQTLTSLGALYRPQERYEEAGAAYEEALPILREIRGDEHPDTLACLGNQAEVLAHLGKTVEAEARMRELIEIRRRVFGPRHERVGIAVNNLGDFLRENDRPKEAIELLKEARQIFSDALGEGHFRVAMASHNLGFTLLRSGEAEDALVYLQEAADVMGGAVPADHWILAQMRLSLGEGLLRLGLVEEAEPLILASRDRIVEHFGEGHSRSERAEQLAGELASVLAEVPASP